MSELANKLNHPTMEIYSSFNQAASHLVGLMAVDYFFAKEISQSITFTAPDTSASACFSEELQSDQQQWFHLLIALSASLREGHSCLPLLEVAGKRLFSDGTNLDRSDSVNAHVSQATKEHVTGFLFSDIQSLRALLAKLPLIESEQQPIVLSHGRLYLRRYYQFEQDLKQVVATRRMISFQPTTDKADNSSTDVEQIKNIIAALFPELATQQEEGNSEIDWQAVAVANAMNKDFAIIAGGPGTGKTYTVTKLLAALVMLASDHTNKQANQQVSEENTLPRIALVAPTGKAAQRLSESITDAVKGFRGKIDDKVLDLIPEQAQTLHRLLGVIPDQVNFRHHQENLLAIDILLIDEVSMVDLPMMTRIFRALPASTKVILLGDADQLPSVAVGSVLADFAPRPHPGYSSDNYHYLSQVTGYQTLTQDNESTNNDGHYSNADCVTFLMKSRRFDGEGAIGRMANYVIKGQHQASWQLLQQSEAVGNDKQLSLLSGDIDTWLTRLVEQYYLPLSQCDDIEEAFALLAKFRILSSTRKGPQGVENLNALVIDILRDKAAITVNRFDSNYVLYPSQPIMISENDYRLGVFNGDVGLLWRNIQGHLMAVFENANGDYDWILPSRLPKFDTVYAMTIHKTQGSEFNHVAMVLPEQKDNKLLSRELLYTGITRAKQQLSIASNQQVWQTGVSQQVKRYSGLATDAI
ncbi:exodeoxyribonuclease V subunit alpha [Colwellia sp. M166]|uniref:exodeoxyribonuclease V subunit alpha n=1 Tax=Colwellia sp. M166 TaxID=2583805 RepID=UPI00211F3E60|nr:exodeoxyribonuclease V subunit alpha [Colwellia sp. M166]|tara:strand:+ start:1628 stop:3721 length:2094 start_codon:yes stop_codon:yes gene_type:complete